MAVEDFDAYNSYGGDAGQWVWDLWADGYGGNGTGSTLGNEFEPVMSRDVVVGDGQALPLRYDNTGAFIDLNGALIANPLSEISRSFSPAQDLTRNNAKTLMLWIRGDQINTAQATDSLYLVLTDATGQKSTVVVAPPADLLKSYWQRKELALGPITGVDLTQITGLALGIGNPDSPQIGGSGLILVDDIVLATE